MNARRPVLKIGGFQSATSYGVGLALLGALLLTPDALLMRISGMSTFQMLGWRGLYLGCCVDTLRRILMRFGIAEYEGAKYATSTESNVQMWTRPCMRCRCAEPRPKNLYLCDTCRNGTGYSSGIAEPQGFG